MALRNAPARIRIPGRNQKKLLASNYRASQHSVYQVVAVRGDTIRFHDMPLFIHSEEDASDVVGLMICRRH